jgi:protocatechuate 3,4-dioxygenase beta subunit
MFISKAKIATALFLAVTVTASTFGVVRHQTLAADQPTTKPCPEAKSKDNGDPPAPAARSKPDAKDTIEVRGQVLDPDGKPFAGAKLYLGGHTRLKAPTYKAPAYPVRATSGADGYFAFTFTKSELDKADPEDARHQLLAVAEGYGCAWVTADTAAQELTLRLVQDAPVSGRILDADGKPVAGAKLTSTGVGMAKDGKDGGFTDLIRVGYFSNVLARGWVGPLPGQPAVLTTGADGTFRLAGIGRDRVVALLVEGRGIATAAIGAHGATFEHRADISRPIRGVVRNKNTGETVAGATVFWQHTYNRRYAVMPVRYHMTITDQHGRYELLGVPKSSGTYGAGYLAVRPALGQPYLQHTVTLKDTPGLDPMTVDIELVQGEVTVSGKVTDEATGQPIPQALVEYYPVNPNPYANKLPLLSYPRSEATTGPDGSYALSVLLGPGVIGVVAGPLDAGGSSMLDAYKRPHVAPEEIKAFFKAAVSTAYFDIAGWASGGNGFNPIPPAVSSYGSHALVLLEPAETDTAFVKDVALEPAQQRKGWLIGPDDQPLTGTLAWGLSSGNVVATQTTLRAAEFTVRGINPKAPRQLAFHHKGKNLGFFLRELPADKDGPLIIKLQPCGSISGRVVDADGQPVAGLRLQIGDPRTALGGYWNVTTDKEGGFRAEGVVPGLECKVWPREKGGYLASDVIVESGKNKHVGDVTLR